MTELKKIILKAKKQVFSNLSGENLTRLKGDGLDIRDIKSYEWGDDVRRINWRATAKTDEILVNTYDEYKQLNISLIYLSSPTLNFGSLRFKKDVVTEVFAYLLYSSLKNHDRCESVIYQKHIVKTIKPPKQLNQIDNILKTIYEYEPKERVDFNSLSHFINKTYKKGHIIIFIGDFLEELDTSLLSNKHQYYSIIVRDKLEEELEFAGELFLKDFYTNKSYDFNITSSTKQRYKELLLSHDTKIKEQFIKKQIRYKKIYTNDEVYLNLRELFR